MKGEDRCLVLVDDEQSIINALRRELRDWAEERSLEILGALSAREALDTLEARGADPVIVVSDLRMPEMKGSDFLLEVKKRYPEAISILLTGFSETEEVIKAVQAGIFSFMLKPWESDYLLSELTKAYDYGMLRSQRADYLKKVEEELKWAGEMQKALLKPNFPRTEEIEFRVSYRPVPGLYCGGDYYDVILLGADRYLLLMGDVAGHGVKAAFVTGVLKAIIYPEYVRAVIGREFFPGAFLGWLNERMNYEFRNASSMLITFFAGVLDLKASRLRYANAGHNHPYLVKDGRSVELSLAGPAIGFANSLSYEEGSVELAAGDLIYLYTDGLVEGAGSAGGALVELGPILDRIEYGAEYHRLILEAALKEAGAAEFADDVTIMTARIR